MVALVEDGDSILQLLPERVGVLLGAQTYLTLYQVDQAVGNLRHRQLIGACLTALQVAGTQFGQVAGGIGHLEDRLLTIVLDAEGLGRGLLDVLQNLVDGAFGTLPAALDHLFGLLLRMYGQIATGAVAKTELELP